VIAAPHIGLGLEIGGFGAGNPLHFNALVADGVANGFRPLRGFFADDDLLDDARLLAHDGLLGGFENFDDLIAQLYIAGAGDGSIRGPALHVEFLLAEVDLLLDGLFDGAGVHADTAAADLTLTDLEFFAYDGNGLAGSARLG